MTDVLAVAGGSSGLLLGLCVLACPVIMGAMMWGMRRGGGGSPQPPTDSTADPAKQAELARLRAEIDQLKAAKADTGERPTSQHR
ncbi:MAG: hypothetical protein ACYCPS_05510 [Candidatus Saccharimonadales bacterium]